MITKPMSHDELQHIEHATKILEQHFDALAIVEKESLAMMGEYLPKLRGYLDVVAKLRQGFSDEVTHMIKSCRELGLITKNTQNLHDFIASVQKLDEVLTPELVDKLSKVLK